MFLSSSLYFSFSSSSTTGRRIRAFISSRPPVTPLGTRALALSLIHCDYPFMWRATSHWPAPWRWEALWAMASRETRLNAWRWWSSSSRSIHRIKLRPPSSQVRWSAFWPTKAQGGTLKKCLRIGFKKIVLLSGSIKRCLTGAYTITAFKRKR